MGLPSISSVSEMSVLFDSGDGGGFVDASLVIVVAIDGTRYAWRRSSDPDEMTKMLQWIDRQYSGTPSP